MAAEIDEFTPSKGTAPTSRNSPTPPLGQPRNLRFWIVFIGIGIATMITAIELSAVSIFGRRVIILSSLAIMALGSALCGSAKTMTRLIAGRTVQGLGGGGIASTTAIIISDLVPLSERGLYNGLIGIAWAMSSGIGPIIGGALAQGGQWRWLFYLNLPICGVAECIMVFFLRVRTPPGTFNEKIRRIDWAGTLLVIAATTACVIGLTWSGIEYSWGSAAVLTPLIIGVAGLVAFIVFESLVPKHPLVPRTLLSTITGISGYTQTFIMPILMIGIIYYVPVYLQACKAASAIGSGVDVLSFSLVTAPSGFIGGTSVNRTGRYRPPMWIAWTSIMVGLGLLTTLDADSPLGHIVGFLVPCAVRCGILTTTTYFPVLAPLPVSYNGLAIAFFMFLRNFAQVWGVTIGGTVLQNELQRRLPSNFTTQYPQGTAIAYATIPTISDLPEPLRGEVRVAFASSLRVVWQVLLAISGVGFLSSLTMKSLPLHSAVDDEWTFRERRGTDDAAE